LRSHRYSEAVLPPGSYASVARLASGAPRRPGRATQSWVRLLARSLIEEAGIRHKGLPHSMVTLSCGVASVYHYGEFSPDWSPVISRVDQTLYRAKQDGRNCVSDRPCTRRSDAS
jgi:GGDEF domain-containing protein